MKGRTKALILAVLLNVNSFVNGMSPVKKGFDMNFWDSRWYKLLNCAVENDIDSARSLIREKLGNVGYEEKLFENLQDYVNADGADGPKEINFLEINCPKNLNCRLVELNFNSKDGGENNIYLFQYFDGQVSSMEDQTHLLRKDHIREAWWGMTERLFFQALQNYRKEYDLPADFKDNNFMQNLTPFYNKVLKEETGLKQPERIFDPVETCVYQYILGHKREL